MYVIEIRFQAREKFSEVFSQIEAESMVEDIVSCSLLQIFDAIYIEDVTLHHFPTEKKENECSTQNV